MSPIVYVPPKKHECEPPRQGQRFITSYGALYPAGTIWKCDECASQWELEYYWLPPRREQDVKNGIRNGKVIWNRLDD